MRLRVTSYIVPSPKGGSNGRSAPLRARVRSRHRVPAREQDRHARRPRARRLARLGRRRVPGADPHPGPRERDVVRDPHHRRGVRQPRWPGAGVRQPRVSACRLLPAPPRDPVPPLPAPRRRLGVDGRGADRRRLQLPEARRGHRRRTPAELPEQLPDARTQTRAREALGSPPAAQEPRRILERAARAGALPPSQLRPLRRFLRLGAGSRGPAHDDSLPREIGRRGVRQDSDRRLSVQPGRRTDLAALGRDAGDPARDGRDRRRDRRRRTGLRERPAGRRVGGGPGRHAVAGPQRMVGRRGHQHPVLARR